MRIALRLLAAIATILSVHLALSLSLLLVGGDTFLALSAGQVPSVDADAASQSRRIVEMLYGVVRAWMGDLGISSVTMEPVRPLLLGALVRTLAVVIPAVFVGATLGGVLGAYSAWHPGFRGRILEVITSVLATIPPYYLSILVIILFSTSLRWLPATGAGGWEHAVLPIAVMVSGICPWFFRLSRALCLDFRASPLAQGLKGRGLSNLHLLVWHQGRAIAPPTVALFSAIVPAAIGGAAFVEVVFAYPGLGSFFINAISRRDLPEVRAVLMLMAALAVFMQQLGDFCVSWLDPRGRIA